MSISNVATKFVMQQPSVAAVIIGARLTQSRHIADNLRLFTCVCHMRQPGLCICLS